MSTNIKATEVLERQSERGWLLPYLLSLDIADINLTGMSKAERKAYNIQDSAPRIFHGWERWAYWLWIVEYNELPAEPISYIPFENQPDPTDAKAIQDVLQYAVRRHFSWYDEAWLWMVKWLLHGFGRKGLESELERIPEDVKVQWYRTFNLANLLNSPCDWSAHILQGGLRADKRTRSAWSKSTGFYSTPMNICTMMARMNFDTYDRLTDTRLLTTLDPCVGTGSMLLAASNYSLRLYGQDIVDDLCLCSELNGWLWMPWLVHMPEHTQKLLEERYALMLRVQRMRDFLINPEDAPTEEEPQPIGIGLSKSPITIELAQQRRENADAFHEAVRSGELEQIPMFS